MKPIGQAAYVAKTSEVNQEPSFGAALGIIGLCMVFGANTVAVKISLSGLGPFTTAGIRFGIASVAIACWAYVTGRPLLFKKGQFHQLLILTGIFTIQISVMYLGMRLTYASRGVLIGNLQPFFVMILAHFFIKGDRITGNKIAGILLGFSGVACMFLEKESLSTALKTGDLLVLIAVMLWAINAIYTKTIISGFRPYQLAMYPGFFSLPVLFFAACLFDEPMVMAVNVNIVMAMLFQSLVTAAFGFVVWTTMLRKYGAVTLHSYIFIMPVSGVFFGGLLLGEPVVKTNMLIALVLIVAGIVVVHSNGERVMRVLIPFKKEVLFRSK